ncbi:hypothetical protein AB0B56_27755 [Streptosporangium canum]|uniref:hypothetical protein n=1 Tax=Streptosporangium canum TaxID=324952 RepID=UPI00342E70E4
MDVEPTTVREERAYLVRIVTRQALDRLRALGRRKESYIGPWLPGPPSRPSSERSKPASCRACSTSSRRTPSP